MEKTMVELLQERRSIRRYTGEAVPEESLKQILQAGLLSPSGHNAKPWEFVVVKDRETLDKLSQCREGSAEMLKGAYWCWATRKRRTCGRRTAPRP